MRNGGVHIVIDGPCISACTLVLGLIENSNVCVTPRAMLGFHSASAGGMYSADGTSLLWFQYPTLVREWLKSKGWAGPSEQSTLIWMDNEAVRSFFMPCPSTEPL